MKPRYLAGDRERRKTESKGGKHLLVTSGLHLHPHWGHALARKQLELIADHVSHFAWCAEPCPLQLPCLSPSLGQTDVQHWRAMPVWLMKGHADPIANQYVPKHAAAVTAGNEETSPVIYCNDALREWEAEKHCCCTIKPWTVGNERSGATAHLLQL